MNLNVIKGAVEPKLCIPIRVHEIESGVFEIEPVVAERISSFYVVAKRIYPETARADLCLNQYSGAALQNWFGELDHAQTAFEYARANSDKWHIVMKVGGKRITEPDELAAMGKEAWLTEAISVTSRCDVNPDAEEGAIAEAAISLLGFCLLLTGFYDEAEGVCGAEAEGARQLVTVSRCERSAKNRMICLAKYGYTCQVCGFDFEREYGNFAAGMIEVHHVQPVSELGGAQMIDPSRDLIPLCPNCHAAIHRTNPLMSIGEFKELVERRRREKNRA